MVAVKPCGEERMESYCLLQISPWEDEKSSSDGWQLCLYSHVNHLMPLKYTLKSG